MKGLNIVIASEAKQSPQEIASVAPPRQGSLAMTENVLWRQKF
jgi:hypothetical protein